MNTVRLVNELRGYWNHNALYVHDVEKTMHLFNEKGKKKDQPTLLLLSTVSSHTFISPRHPFLCLYHILIKELLVETPNFFHFDFRHLSIYFALLFRNFSYALLPYWFIYNMCSTLICSRKCLHATQIKNKGTKTSTPYMKKQMKCAFLLCWCSGT